MAEIFGVVAAGIMLGPELLRLSRSLRKTFNTIQNAPRDANKLANEIEIFAGLYEDFLDVCSSNEKHDRRSSAPVKRLIAWAREATNGITKLLARVQALIGRSVKSKAKKLLAHLRWFFSNEEVKLLRSSLNVARESMIGFSNICVIERLDTHMRTLNAAMAQDSGQTIEHQTGISVEVQMRMLKQKSRNRRQQRHINEKRLTEAVVHLKKQQEKITQRSDVVPDTRQLLQFTKSVEHYIEDAWPSQQSGRRGWDRSSHPTTRLRHERADSAQPSVSIATTSFASEPSSSRPSRKPSSSVLRSTNPPTMLKCSECRESCTHMNQTGRHVSQAVSCSPLSRFAEATFDDDSSRRVRKRYRASNSDGSVMLNPPSPVHSFHEVSTTSGVEAVSSLPELPVDQTELLVDRENVPLSTLLHREGSHDLSSEAGGSIENVVWTTTTRSDATRESQNSVFEDAENPEDTGHSHESVAADNGNDSGTEEIMANDDEEGAPSPFQPVAGTIGRFPNGWQTRHERSESPQDFWHNRL